MHNEEWTPQELDLLAKHFRTTSNEDLELIMNGSRTANAIAKKAHRLGITKDPAYLATIESRLKPAEPNRFVTFLLTISLIRLFYLRRFRRNLKTGQKVVIHDGKGVRFVAYVHHIHRYNKDVVVRTNQGEFLSKSYRKIFPSRTNS